MTTDLIQADLPHLSVPLEGWPPMDWPAQPIRTEAPSRREMFELRVLIVLATASLLALLIWLTNPFRIGDPIAYAGLTVALFLRGICWFFEWYNYWVISVPVEINPQRNWTVDILTTACPGEPAGMIVRTLRAMTAIRYPHTNYLCDEGNDPYLKKICEDLGVIHVTRTERKHAKAGNINNALRQATGQIAVVLDPDHEPAPYLLDRTLGYFEDPAVGFVQSVQAYRNQKDSFVAQAAAEQSYHFYGPYMMGTNGHDTTQAIGANCVFRRTALDSIGGHAPGLAEDMHTAMQLYAKGWRSIYLPEILTRGLTPSTLAAFYKQQLKWACGAFDLLFQQYPHLFRSFTLRQKIHYFLCPVFFLRGAIGLLEMVIPILCLTYGFIAWRAPILDLIAWFFPVLVFGVLVRLRAQRWLMEPHERGMHFPAGLLTIATWWIYLIGVVCAVCRIKIPYIPTPKEDKPIDDWKVALPNFIAAGILLAVVILGLRRDSSPPSLLMAGLASVNALALAYVSVISQQVTMHRIAKAFAPLSLVLRSAQRAGSGIVSLYYEILRRIREGWAIPTTVVLITLGVYFYLIAHPQTRDPDAPLASNQIETGGFYTGLNLGGLSDPLRLARVSKIEKQLDFHFRIVSLEQGWGDRIAFPTETLKQLRRQGSVPLLMWLPTIDPSSGPGHVGSLDRGILKSISEGKFDAYLREFADKVRTFGEPILITFAPQPDNPEMPWSPSGGNTSTDFVRAWRHVVTVFDTEGAANAGWVWNPGGPTHVDNYFPGEAGEGYVDWIGLSLDDRTDQRSFAETYEPFRSAFATWGLPIMVMDLNMDQRDGVDWLRQAMLDIGRRYPEIKAALFKDGDRPGVGKPQSQISGLPQGNAGPIDDLSSLSSVTQDLHLKPFNEGAARPPSPDQPMWFDLHPAPRKLTSIQGGPGHFSLMVDGAPFYVKGIAYNTGHDWRDAAVPLSRSVLDSDFSEIKLMGANSIRRYGETWWDRNILNAAADHHLKVLYGFWFFQDVDYLTQEEKERAYQHQIEATVVAYRDHPGVLGWCLGNEVWGLLKHKYRKPYLTEVRHAHVLFVEKMAEKIKELDPNHPVFCAQESDQIGGAVSDYAVGAPSLDVIGVNSYYQIDIAHLDETISRIDPSRPYLVSEYGPTGYWKNSQNQYDQQSGLLEDTAVHKAWLYAYRWREYIQANLGRNIGGIAYCWSDRYEGTSTWFGMNDLDRRPKPAAAAVKDAWQSPDPRLGGSFAYKGPKILNMEYPTTPQWPHEPFIVKSDVELLNDEPARFLWSVTGPGFKSNVGHLELMNNGSSASIELPAIAGWYRIQLKILGTSGLDEANVPVLVQISDPKHVETREGLVENVSRTRH